MRKTPQNDNAIATWLTFHFFSSSKRGSRKMEISFVLLSLQQAQKRLFEVPFLVF